jgi:hypothetical protein
VGRLGQKLSLAEHIGPSPYPPDKPGLGPFDSGPRLHLFPRDNEDEARQAKVLTKDEARRIAINVARLPQLLGKADG